MRYYFIFFSLVVILLLSVFGLPGKVKSLPPIELFPDMDRQDKVMYQANSDFFSDGMASRMPVNGTVHLAYENYGDVSNLLKGDHLLDPESFYYTGKINGEFQDVIPSAFLDKKGYVSSNVYEKGRERYDIYCSMCHGPNADGKSIINSYKVLLAPSLLLSTTVNRSNGEVFDIISNGKGNMKGYKANISVDDRWAIVSYLKLLQENQTGKSSENMK